MRGIVLSEDLTDDIIADYFTRLILVATTPRNRVAVMFNAAANTHSGVAILVCLKNDEYKRHAEMLGINQDCSYTDMVAAVQRRVSGLSNLESYSCSPGRPAQLRYFRLARITSVQSDVLPSLEPVVNTPSRTPGANA